MIKDEPRFQNARKIEGVDRGEDKDIARSLDDPYTVIEDKSTGDCYLVYDAEKADAGGSIE